MSWAMMITLASKQYKAIIKLKH